MKTCLTILCLLLLAAAASAGETASADGVTIRYDVAGQGAPALVFVHGWSCDRTYWRHQTAEFAADRTVVTIDLAGHGESGADRADWTIGAFADDVAAVVRHLGLDDVVLVGHSMSGPIIVEAAGRLGGAVRGLIPVDTLHDVTAEYTDEQREGFLAAFAADFPAATDGFVRGMFPADADPALVDLVAGDMASAPPAVAVAAMRGLFVHDTRPSLAALTVPVRCLNADMWPMNLEANRSVYADVGLVLMEGAGHFPFLEDPDTFNGKLAEILRGME